MVLEREHEYQKMWHKRGKTEQINRRTDSRPNQLKPINDDPRFVFVAHQSREVNDLRQTER